MCVCWGGGAKERKWQSGSGGSTTVVFIILTAVIIYVCIHISKAVKLYTLCVEPLIVIINHNSVNLTKYLKHICE